MQRALRSGRYAPAHTIFFLLACLQAVIQIPLWAASWVGWWPGGDALAHAHAMLLGFAVAIIGGFLFTRLTLPRITLAVAAWLAGRLAFALPADWAALAGLSFPAVLAVFAGLPFLRSARSGHNVVFFPVLAGFLAAEALYQAGALGWLEDGRVRGVWLAFDLVSLLLLVMGGRILPAAMAGILRLRGQDMPDRNQPGLERACMAGMAAAALGHLMPWSPLAAAGWAVAGIAGMLRLVRWRFDAALGQPSLWPLHLGYLWLCGGLAAASVGDGVIAIHATTIGGLGTIGATMMVRTVMQRERISAIFPRLVLAAVGLITAAALARLAAPLAPAPLMAASAGLWALAFGLVGAAILRLLPYSSRS